MNSLCQMKMAARNVGKKGTDAIVLLPQPCMHDMINMPMDYKRSRAILSGVFEVSSTSTTDTSVHHPSFRAMNRRM